MASSSSSSSSTWRQEDAIRVTLRHANVAASENRPSPEDLRKTRSTDIKKNGNFVRKLKQCSKGNASQLVVEMQKLNLTRYLDEGIIHMSEAKLRSADALPVTELLSAFYQTYPDFVEPVAQNWERVFEPLSKGNKEEAQEMAEKVSSRRAYLRILMELVIVAALPEKSWHEKIIKIVQSLIIGGIRGRSEMTSCLAVVMSFLRTFGPIILVHTPDAETSSQQATTSTSTSDGTDEDLDMQERRGVVEESQISFEMTPERQELVSIFDASFREGMKKSFNVLFEKGCDQLVYCHEKILELESQKKQFAAGVAAGETNEQNQAFYQEMTDHMERLMSHLTILGSALGRNLPVLREPDPEPAEELVTEPSKPKFEPMELEDDSEWDSLETKWFYEELINLADRVPGDLLLLSKPESTTVAGSTSEEPGSEAEKSLFSSNKAKAEALFASLPGCQSRQLIDDVCVQLTFSDLRPEVSRKALIRALLSQPHEDGAMLPFYARLVACLHPYFPDIFAGLESELWLHTKECLTDESDEKSLLYCIRNVRFLGELTKFGLHSSEKLLDFLTSTLEAVSDRSIIVCCALLECCGRYLYRRPETHKRCSSLLRQLMRLRNSEITNPDLQTLVDDAYGVSCPLDVSASAEAYRKRACTHPLIRYIDCLLHRELTGRTAKFVLNQLRKLPWSSPLIPWPENHLIRYAPSVEDQLPLTSDELCSETARLLLAVTRTRYSNISIVASLVASIARKQEQVAVRVVDEIWLLIRRELAVPVQYCAQQRLLLTVKLFGELYNYKYLKLVMIFDALYCFIRAYPKNSPPEDTFRIQLCCTLLDTVLPYIKGTAHMQRLQIFLAHLALYINQTRSFPLPVGIEMALSDTLDRVPVPVPSTMEEARDILQLVYGGSVVNPSHGSGRTFKLYNMDESRKGLVARPSSICTNPRTHAFDSRKWWMVILPDGSDLNMEESATYNADYLETEGDGDMEGDEAAGSQSGTGMVVLTGGEEDLNPSWVAETVEDVEVDPAVLAEVQEEEDRSIRERAKARERMLAREALEMDSLMNSAMHEDLQVIRNQKSSTTRQPSLLRPSKGSSVLTPSAILGMASRSESSSSSSTSNPKAREGTRMKIALRQGSSTTTRELAVPGNTALGTHVRRLAERESLKALEQDEIIRKTVDIAARLSEEEARKEAAFQRQQEALKRRNPPVQVEDTSSEGGGAEEEEEEGAMEGGSSSSAAQQGAPLGRNRFFRPLKPERISQQKQQKAKALSHLAGFSS